MLDKAFKVWWPTLEEELNKLTELKDNEVPDKNGDNETANSEILEEILNLSRLNQKLLRNPDSDTRNQLIEMNDMLQSVLSRLEKERRTHSKKRRRFHPEMLEELMHMSPKFRDNYVPFQIIISQFKDDFPWLYDSGMEVVKTLKSGKSGSTKEHIVNEFMELIEYSFEHPMMRELVMPDKEQYMILRELPYMLKRTL